MNTPAFMPCNRCISIHLAGLNCLPCKLAPRAAEILSQPPTQTEGGRAQGRWTGDTKCCLLRSVSILSLLLSFLQLKSRGVKVSEGSSPQTLRSLVLSISGTRKKWSYSFASLPIPRPIFFHVPLLPLPSHWIREAKEHVHHLAPTFFLHTPRSLTESFP